MNKYGSTERDWEWRYTFWAWIMYGPIPVGIIIVAIFFAGYLVYKLTE